MEGGGSVRGGSVVFEVEVEGAVSVKRWKCCGWRGSVGGGRISPPPAPSIQSLSYTCSGSSILSNNSLQ